MSAVTVSRGVEEYAICTFYIPRNPNEWDVHITVTPNLDVHLQAVRSMYREWETGISFSATIQKNTVSLYIPADPWEVDNWELFLLKSHTMPMKIIDKYEPGREIPYFAVGIKLKDNTKPRPLRTQLHFNGLDQSTYITIVRNPESPETGKEKFQQEVQPPSYRTSNEATEIYNSLRDDSGIGSTSTHPQSVDSNMGQVSPRVTSAVSTGATVEEEYKHLKKMFTNLVRRTCDGVIHVGIGVSKVVDQIIDVSSGKTDRYYFIAHADDLRASRSVPAIFDRVRQHWDYLHPEIYGSLIQEIPLPDLEPVQEKYQTALDQFLDKTPVSEFCEIQDVMEERDGVPPEGFTKCITEHAWDLRKTSLRVIEDLRRDFAPCCNLQSCAFSAVGIRLGSVAVTFQDHHITSSPHHPLQSVPDAAQTYCMECSMPECMSLILTVCATSDGVKFFSEAHDFTLEIPKGAIPKNERITLHVGVALFGPFQFPENLRPVSPLFWACVCGQRNFHFSKPVTISIPHFLNLESDQDIHCLRLTFLKARHNKNSKGLYELCTTDENATFQASNNFGVLETSHFCSLCIACIDTLECLNKTEFCMTSLLPKRVTAVGKKQPAFFFVTFCNLKTCLKKVDEFVDKNGLEEYELLRESFKFERSTKHVKHALEMVVTQPNHAEIGVIGKKQIFRSEVDFKRTAPEELQEQEHMDLYPPRFKVFLVSSPQNTTLSGGKIEFKGARCDFEYGIHLDSPFSTATPVTPGHSQNGKIGKLDKGRDLGVAKGILVCFLEINGELRDLFRELGLDNATLQDHYENYGLRQYAEYLLCAWINGRDDVLNNPDYPGGATWENLRKALTELGHHGAAEEV